MHRRMRKAISGWEKPFVTAMISDANIVLCTLQLHRLKLDGIIDI